MMRRCCGLVAVWVVVSTGARGAEPTKVAAPPPPIVAMGLSVDGNRPMGTVWRYFEQWQTDVCRTDAGELIRVDPLDPRLYENAKGEWVSVKHDYFDGFAPSKTYRVKPATAVRGSPPPPPGWEKADFDDGEWARLLGPAIFRYRSLSQICLRGTFDVADPQQAGDLSLAVGFRGGVVVYVNGKELGRAGMPEGQVTADTLATDYPAAAELCTRPDGNLILQSSDQSRVHCHPWNVEELPKDQRPAAMAPVVERYARRQRTLDLKIPADALRKGVNVIAIEAHRAPAPPVMFTTDTRRYAYALEMLRLNYWWDRVAVETVRLTGTPGAKGVTPNVAQAPGLHVVTQPGFVTSDPTVYGAANERPAAIRLAGLKNGAYGAQAVVTSNDPVKGLRAVASDLTGPGGTIPAAAVRYAYAKWFRYTPAGQSIFDTLDAAPPAEVNVLSDNGRKLAIAQPIWVTVQVPRGAAAGAYRGKLTITADGNEPIEIPIELSVIGDWALPDPFDFHTFVAFTQSPDALSMQYNVPMWSDVHWKLIDQSFALLAQLSDKEIVVPLVSQTHLGNPHTMGTWTKQADGTYKADLRNVERYVETAVKRLGKIPSVCLIINADDERKAREQTFTVLDPATGELREEPLPKLGTPEAIAFWKPVFAGVNQILAKHGLEKSLTLYATQFSRWTKACDAAAKELAPQAKLITRTHIGSDFTGRRFYLAIMNGSGVYWDPDEDGPYYGWRSPLDTISFPREAGSSKNWGPGIYVNTPVGFYRFFAEETLLNGHGGPEGRRPDARRGLTRHGFGQLGGDFWPVLKDPTGRGNDKVLCVRYQDEGSTGFQSSVPFIIGPGAEGPVPTARFQMLREGLQDAEARVFVQDALADHADQLGAELARRCKDACDAHTRMLRYLVEYHVDGSMTPHVIREQSRRLYDAADAVAKALKR